MCGLAAGFVTAMIFVLHIVPPPYNIHPGILGLAVNVTVLLIASAAQTGPAAQPVRPSPAANKPGYNAFIACGITLVALANWPLLILFNRIYPFVLGLPFFIFAMLVLNLSVGLLLFAAYRATIRSDRSTRSPSASLQP